MSLDIFEDYFFSGEYSRANDDAPVPPERWDAYLVGQLEITTITNVLLEMGFEVKEIQRIGFYFGQLRAMEWGWFQ